MPKSLGTAVKAFRERAGVTQFGLAKAAKIDPTILSRLEAGERKSIRFEYVVALAEALGVSVDDVAVEAGFKRRTGPRAQPAADRARLQAQVRTVLGHLRRALASLESLP